MLTSATDKLPQSSVTSICYANIAFTSPIMKTCGLFVNFIIHNTHVYNISNNWLKGVLIMMSSVSSVYLIDDDALKLTKYAA